MRAWMGWTATPASAVMAAPTWDEWSARQRRILSREKRQQAPLQESAPFSERSWRACRSCAGSIKGDALIRHRATTTESDAVSAALAHRSSPRPTREALCG
jgi:hypothetical protein